MHRALLFAIACGGISAAVACGAGKTEQLSDTPFPATDSGESVIPNTPTGPAGSGLRTGLPCDVQALIEERCVGCHSGEQPGTPKLSEYPDFLLPSKGDPNITMAQAAILRMKSTTNPMPPKPAEPSDTEEIQTMEEWVKGGTKMFGACTTPPPAPTDGGTPVLPEAGADAAVLCTSGKMWTGGNTASPEMHPGGACSACHQARGGPRLRFGGTVYAAPTGAHDVDDCNGIAPATKVTVTVTDKDGKTLSADVNAAGNFFVRSTRGGGPNSNQLAPPFKAKITDGTKTRVMVGTVTSADCNFCHSAAGINGAPGRILAPQ